MSVNVTSVPIISEISRLRAFPRLLTLEALPCSLANQLHVIGSL